MASVGSLEPFDVEQPQKWTTYMEHFKPYVLANGVTDEAREKAAFLTLAGPHPFKFVDLLGLTKTDK